MTDEPFTPYKQLFNIIHSLTVFPEAPLQSRSFHYSSRSNNSLPIVPYQCHSTQFLNSFFFSKNYIPLAVWNTLPTEAVTLNSAAFFEYSISNFIGYMHYNSVWLSMYLLFMLHKNRNRALPFRQ